GNRVAAPVGVRRYRKTWVRVGSYDCTRNAGIVPAENYKVPGLHISHGKVTGSCSVTNGLVTTGKRRWRCDDTNTRDSLNRGIVSVYSASANRNRGVARVV